MVANAIVPLDKNRAIEGVKMLAALVRELREGVFKEGQDYGVIPGTNEKPVLLLPGMEKLMRALHLRAEYVERRVITDFDKPLFFFEYECRLIDVESETCISTAIGSANSMESKWAWRWVPLHRVPSNLDPSTLVTRGGRISEFTFAVEKAETSGKYGKPAEYWQQFQDAIANGTAKMIKRKDSKGTERDAWEIDSSEYRVPNPDVFDQLNTICKIAQKRALSSAIKGAANVSEFFTVDLDDLPQYQISTPAQPSNIIEAEFEDVTPPAQSMGNGSAPRRNTRNMKRIEEAVKQHYAAHQHFVNHFNNLSASGEITDTMTDDEVIAVINANRESEGKANKAWWQDGELMSGLKRVLWQRWNVTLEQALKQAGKKLTDYADSAALIADVEAAQRETDDSAEVVDIPF